MLELLCAGGGKPYYAKSGPGPKTLQAGSEQAGYFGTLTQAQLFTAAEIFNQVGISAIGPNTDASTLWGKFFYKQNHVNLDIAAEAGRYFKGGYRVSDENLAYTGSSRIWCGHIDVGSWWGLQYSQYSVPTSSPVATGVSGTVIYELDFS